MSLAAIAEPARDLSLAVTVPEAPAGATLMVPTGIASPEAAITDLRVDGGHITRIVSEPRLKLSAAVVETAGGPLTVRYTASQSQTAPIPAEAFERHESTYTVAASELAAHAKIVAEAAGGGHAGVQAIVDDAASRFDYDHPDKRFNDGCSTVPLIACGSVPGSCVDINTYLVAALRAAGYEAAYIAGYFFPAEKAGRTFEMHCWVLSRHAGQTLAWDIAHHKKMGATKIRPALNPKPGARIATTHSMGHAYPAVLAGPPIKLLAEPMWLANGALTRAGPFDVHLTEA